MRSRIIALAVGLALTFTPLSFGQAPAGPYEQRRQAVVVEVSEGGFSWADAAIGAAAASGAALALLGLSMFRRQLRKEDR
jgi:hypothetical protein